MLDEVSGKHRAPAALSPGMNLGTHGIGGWVGARDVPDSLEQREIHAPAEMRRYILYFKDNFQTCQLQTVN